MIMRPAVKIAFESDVISDGTQIPSTVCLSAATFESDVISDGTQICKVS